MNARRSSTLVAGLAAGLLAVAACGGTASAPATGGTASPEPAATTTPTATPTAVPTAAPTDAAGTPTAGRTGRIEIADEKVAITLPDDWAEVVLSGDDVEGILGNFPDGTFTDEQLAAMQAAIGTGMKLMAWGRGDVREPSCAVGTGCCAAGSARTPRERSRTER